MAEYWLLDPSLLAGAFKGRRSGLAASLTGGVASALPGLPDPWGQGH